jgi:raffinose/stachyose/melibiose transport system substrate-binding protein
MMKKIVKSLLLLSMVSMTVFGTGTKESSGQDDGKIDLRVLNYIDMSEPNSANEVAMIWDKFAEENPNINVIREDLFNEPFHQKTEAYVASGNVPDVVYMWPSGRSTSLQTTGSVKDLMPFLEKDGLVDSYNPAILAPQAAGYLAELASGFTATHMLYVNKTLLMENGFDMPKTFEEMKAMAAPLKAKGIELIGMDNQSAWVMQSCLFSMIVGRYGGPNWYEDLQAGKIKFTDPWFVNSLEIVNELYESGMINRNSLASPYGSGRANFATGKSAFFIDGDWSTGAFQTDISTGDALIDRAHQESDVELTIMPALPNEMYPGTNSGVVSTGFGMSANIEDGSAKEAAAWKLIKFLQSEYVQTYRLTTGAGFPSNLNIDVDKVVVENNLEPLVAKRAKFYELPTEITPVVDGVLDPEVVNVINVGLQEIGLGEKTPQKVAAETQAAYEQWKADNN